ncbi:MAG: ligase-associated DNA damage response endonuclease PdeM [Burkholderiaceae bacterium]|nr:ligase-associated DNA damage response endonuclease PdeM [Burkholderiaceae bacterium]MCU0965295.1 ligase-associated DNA damage response endonuclease PdeM [Burkholderiaceae bacterium]
MVEIDVAGVRLGLLPQRAALLVEQRCLLVADAHIGKAVSFRRLGVPVPSGTTAQTLQRLSEAIELSGARRVVFLGDLLHSAHAHAPATLQALAQWRSRHAAVELLLVRGNHDDHAGDPPTGLGVQAVDEPLSLGGLALCHHPQARPGAYVLAGHLHPCVVLGGRAHQRLRLPCFHFGEKVGVLPAFGAFTGMHALRPRPGERVFVVADDAVSPLPMAAQPKLAE